MYYKIMVIIEENMQLFRLKLGQIEKLFFRNICRFINNLLESCCCRKIQIFLLLCRIMHWVHIQIHLTGHVGLM